MKSEPSFHALWGKYALGGGARPAYELPHEGHFVPRFAVLDHDWPMRHWDFLLEAGSVLRAWRLLGEPVPGTTVPAEANFDHRLLYLDFEGPLGGDRGSVAKWDTGVFDWIEDGSDRVVVELRGAKLVGRVELERQGDTWMARFASFRDHFSGHAADYREFRPAYPTELFAFLASVAPDRMRAWDCGTGNGQAAVGLAQHFDRVFATDASEQQIRQAPPHARVEYAVAPAERCPLPNASVDLVLVAQALHWFDFDRFHAEVRRVGRPGALLAATCYYEPSVNDRVNAVLGRFQHLVRSYWPPGREWVDAGYQTIPFPFPELATPPFAMTLESDLPRFLGYLGTWSATKQFAKATGCDPVAQLAGEFAAAWGDPTAVRTVRWAFTVRAGRIE